MAAKNELKPCTCSRYSVLVNVQDTEDGDLTWDDELSTGCKATTRKVFAPGHDAKLKKFLIMCGVEGHEVRRDDGGIAVSADALRFADDYEFGYMVREGVARQLAKLHAKSAKAADKAAKKADAKPLAAEGNKPLAEVVADEQAKFAEEQRAEQAEREQSADWTEEPETTKEDAPTADMVGAEAEQEMPMLGEAVQAKIGRWTYTGYVQNGEFVYTDTKGREQRATKFTLV